ncbi:hypothetical protein H7H82_08230 [Mycobacterium heidelbergense]|uniref:Uncharacterized protein n=1 Tax=Mycobacterium heidelbergense TaxID=53376 RepID=A0A1X0DHX8_MYCHE|nr:Rv1535 family protein [Mycobacterium heidelbergense]MCV7050582.1 hypothetical protein [Mycobacterium heidelbergense]ORA71907.1 hypothetical protein BST25_15830 [Mycobacterium heidelbergense]BBZ49370.1 hypothetical protein MHEI_10870 [Mycobacterium heidelbergense]
MAAVLHDDAVTSPPAPPRLPRLPIGAAGDPLVDAAVRLLSIPLRHAYAVLWRVGLLEVTA